MSYTIICPDPWYNVSMKSCDYVIKGNCMSSLEYITLFVLFMLFIIILSLTIGILIGKKNKKLSEVTRIWN